ncbi:hypothetical protein PoB_002178900 [Plakobranchus ocellatus]|uniref:Uncharacterized protein n=1 Tax=Plakobranchus ocellatus TaxID=259542 RepID=A0AAV3ZLP1_9GAST|nr:hypothetical protein PoB_002178900 [Plakobranchus ocellatus]
MAVNHRDERLRTWRDHIHSFTGFSRSPTARQNYDLLRNAVDIKLAEAPVAHRMCCPAVHLLQGVPNDDQVSSAQTIRLHLLTAYMRSSWSSLSLVCYSPRASS